MTDWATAPFDQFLDSVTENSRLLTLTARAMVLIPRIVMVTQILATKAGRHISNHDSYTLTIEGDWDVTKQGESEAKDPISLTVLEEEARFAHAEAANDFPFLHGQLVISTWSALESTITDFLVLWLMHRPEALEAQPFSKLKITLSEFERRNKEERMRLLLDDLERSLRMESKTGVARFEGLLGAVGLSGPVDEQVGRNLHEMFQVRNVIAHRSSIADRHFIQQCPWVSYAPGDRIMVSGEAWTRYRESAIAYVTTVRARVTAHLQGLYDGPDRPSAPERP